MAPQPGGRVGARLSELGLQLPDPVTPVAAYVPALVAPPHVYISGQLPFVDGKVAVQGHVGGSVSLEDGVEAARLCAVNVLAALNAALDGDLDRVQRTLKVEGFVAAGPDFTDHPKVVNGASDLLAEVLGEAGKHTRCALGMVSLPLGAAVEVSALFEIA